jgi:hypothetical protein
MGKYGNGSRLSIPELREDGESSPRRHHAKTTGSLIRTIVIVL